MNHAPLDVRLYRAAQYLHPPAFRRDFSQEMVHDFSEARTERNGHGLARFWAVMGADLIRSILRQWLRTGWPVIFVAALAGPLTTVSLLASLLRPIRFSVPRTSPDADLITLELLAAAAFIVIAAGVIFTVGFAGRVHPRRRF